MTKDVRWKQRFQNFERAFLFLKEAVEQEKYDKLQAAGLVQSFEFTFELAWKTLKDYLAMQGEIIPFPREVLKKAFSAQLIQNGHVWIEMLDKRNQLSHTYNDAQATKAVDLIRKTYFPEIEQVYETLKDLCSD
ncbi:MAG: nucleotidyltransferase substrate binding protein [Chlamydiia bacterium]|nr:nucleotidyltransferase substrate binding protein [Chlamydiia bacterium]